jgi:hypothetical protein
MATTVVPLSLLELKDDRAAQRVHALAHADDADAGVGLGGGGAGSKPAPSSAIFDVQGAVAFGQVSATWRGSRWHAS